MLRSTLVGRFFAGKDRGEAAIGRGFGHWGCCTLLVIEQVLSIDNVVSNIKPGQLSCYTEGWHEDRGDKDLTARHNTIATSNESWRIKDPCRVAAEALNSCLNKSGPAGEFKGCKTKHLTYDDKKDDQYRTYCYWVSNPGDSYTVELGKYCFLRNSSNSWKNIAWMPYNVSHQHCSENPNPE
jgi:hypothetical protein